MYKITCQPNVLSAHRPSAQRCDPDISIQILELIYIKGRAGSCGVSFLCEMKFSCQKQKVEKLFLIFDDFLFYLFTFRICIYFHRYFRDTHPIINKCPDKELFI